MEYWMQYHNCNPDWGILRWNEDHRLKLELVRETKGNLDLLLLQHSNEGRKIPAPASISASSASPTVMSRVRRQNGGRKSC